jgi:hypothetical protein
MEPEYGGPAGSAAAPADPPMRALSAIEEMKQAVAGITPATAGIITQPAEPDLEDTESTALASLVPPSEGAAASAAVLPEGRLANMAAAAKKIGFFIRKHSLRLRGREHQLHPPAFGPEDFVRVFEEYRSRAPLVHRATPVRTAGAANPYAGEKEPCRLGSYGNAVTWAKLMGIYETIRKRGVPVPFISFWYEVQEGDTEDRWHYDLSFFFRTKELVSSTQSAQLPGAKPLDFQYHWMIGLSDTEIALAQNAVRQEPPIPIVGSFYMSVEDLKQTAVSLGGLGAGPAFEWRPSSAAHRVSYIIIGTQLIITESWPTFEGSFTGSIPAWNIIKVLRESMGVLLGDWNITDIYRPCLLKYKGAGVDIVHYGPTFTSIFTGAPKYTPLTQAESAMASVFQPEDTEYLIGEAVGKCAAWAGILSHLSVETTNLSPGKPADLVAREIRANVYDRIDAEFMSAKSKNEKQALLARMFGHFWGGGRRRKQKKTRTKRRTHRKTRQRR